MRGEKKPQINYLKDRTDGGTIKKYWLTKLSHFSSIFKSLSKKRVLGNETSERTDKEGKGKHEEVDMSQLLLCGVRVREVERWPRIHNVLSSLPWSGFLLRGCSLVHISGASTGVVPGKPNRERCVISCENLFLNRFELNTFKLTLIVNDVSFFNVRLILFQHRFSKIDAAGVLVHASEEFLQPALRTKLFPQATGSFFQNI